MGSPPHRRGKGFKRDFSLLTTRITPAQAGKRLSEKTPAAAPWNHPRVGGEKIRCPTRTRRQTGSPPRGRGKDGEDHLVAQLPGITPAWAGKRRPQQRHRMALQDHPRVGGEKNTLHHSAAHLAEDHPRVGGEKFCAYVPANWGWGSPPRGRGKAAAFAFASYRFGITPAQAGKSGASGCPLSNAWDHPRTGGEKLCLPPEISVGTGSPPHRRGKVLLHALLDLLDGITPAWAGKRSNVPSLKIMVWDHPRVGGEKRALFGELVYPLGSPPHGRGKAFSVLRRQFRFRIAPAWAGKSRWLPARHSN